MRELCIIGAGEAGINLIKELRSLDKDLRISFVDKRDYYFTRKDLFLWWAAKSPCQIIKLEDFAKDWDVQFIKAKVERINFNNRKIFLKDKEAIEFKELVISSGAKSKDLFIKGDFREGFFYLSGVEPFLIKDLLKISSDTIVFASTILGIRLAIYLSFLNLEIKLIAQNLSFLGNYQTRILEFLKEKNIDIYLDATIEEVFGESMVKATKVSLPKVLSSQLVFVDSGFIPNRKFFDAQITVQDNFFTNYERVYFLGEVNNEAIENERFFIFNTQDARAQAHCLAKYLIKKESMPYNRCVATQAEIAGFLDNFIKSEVALTS